MIWWPYARYQATRVFWALRYAVNHVFVCSLGGHRPKLGLGGRCMNCMRIP